MFTACEDVHNLRTQIQGPNQTSALFFPNLTSVYPTAWNSVDQWGHFHGW